MAMIMYMISMVSSTSKVSGDMEEEVIVNTYTQSFIPSYFYLTDTIAFL